MITLNGVGGDGSLLGTFYFARRGTSGTGFGDSPDLDYMTPISSWYCPPPDNRWYDCLLSPYGPRMSHILLGDLVSIADNVAEWNPCEHSTISGDALYRGSSGTSGAWWTKMASSQLSSFTEATMFPSPASTGRRHSVMIGRCCTASDPRCFSNVGTRVNQNLSTSGDAQRYWNMDSVLCGNTASDVIRSTLLKAGPMYNPGNWYIRSINGSTVPAGPAFYRTYWTKTSWNRPSRCVFQRTGILEYHTTDSYVPSHDPKLPAPSGVSSLLECNTRSAECVVTHIKSDTAGRFWIRYDSTTKIDWYGWIPWNYYKGSNVVTTKGTEVCLLILEPGLAPVAEDLVDNGGNAYCKRAKAAASSLYDFRAAKLARTRAVMDVQELDSNWIENLAGAKGTMDVMRPLLDGANALSGGDLKAARKALASAYLVYKYVIAPAISDAEDLNKHGTQTLALATKNRFSRERRRGSQYETAIPISGTRADVSYHTTLYLELRHNAFAEIWAALEKIGLDPSSGQLWDLIPYSFVVDWFANVGDALKAMDRYNSLVLLRDVLSRIESFKVQWPLEEQTIRVMFGGHICSNGKPLEYSWYDRRVYSDIGDVDPLALSTSNGLSLNQMAQGTALITQMI